MTQPLGIAQKKGGIVKNWKRRHFEISGTDLTYSPAKGAKPAGKVDLSRATSVVKAQTAVGLGLTIETPGRVWELGCIEGDVDQWVIAISAACPLIPKSSAAAQTTAAPVREAVPEVLTTPVVTNSPATAAVEKVVDMGGEEPFGLLLCGSGESGKTTFLRQLKLKFHPNGIPDSERQAFVPTIRGNLIETMQMLITWAEKNDYVIDDDLMEQASDISGLNAFNCDATGEIADALQELWSCDAIVEAFGHRDETVIPDHMDYFFEQVQNVMSAGYSPTDEDLLRARIRTIGIDQATLKVDDIVIRFVDVGGQHNERGKIDQIRNSVDGLIYCVSFADFDKPMFEALPLIKPRIDDALAFFGQLMEDPKWSDSPIFLVCNKYDGFTEKIEKTDRFVRAFPDFRGNEHSVDDCAQFLIRKFKELAGSGREMQVLTQVAVDPASTHSNAQKIGRYVRDNYFETA